MDCHVNWQSVFQWILNVISIANLFLYAFGDKIIYHFHLQCRQNKKYPAKFFHFQIYIENILPHKNQIFNVCWNRIYRIEPEINFFSMLTKTDDCPFLNTNIPLSNIVSQLIHYNRTGFHKFGFECFLLRYIQKNDLNEWNLYRLFYIIRASFTGGAPYIKTTITELSRRKTKLYSAYIL